jgi:hypothetical protein
MIKPYFRANPEGKEDLLNTAAITEERKPDLLRMNLFLKTVNGVGEGILHSPELYSFHSAHATGGKRPLSWRSFAPRNIEKESAGAHLPVSQCSLKGCPVQYMKVIHELQKSTFLCVPSHDANIFHHFHLPEVHPSVQ